MFSHKVVSLQSILYSFIAFFLVSCSSDGLLGGKITATFSGIKSVQVTGPESVLIDFVTDRRCTSYQILKLPELTPVQTATLPPVKLKGQSQGISPSQNYNFAVSCVQGSESIGLDKSLSATTWNHFDGRLNPTVDQPDGGFEVSWNYFTDPLIKYNVYARELSANTGNASSLGTLLTGCVVRAGTNKVTIGSPDCPIAGSALNAGSIYEFRVVAVYPDETDSRPHHLMVAPEYAVIRPISSNFDLPNCTLSPLGLGADQNSAILTLRCSPPISASTGCPLNYLSVLARQDGRVVSQGSVSMNADGSTILEITPLTDQSGTGNDRIVKELQLEYTCTSSGSPQLSVVRIDANQPALKYRSLTRKYEYAPEQSYQRSPASGDTSIVAPSALGNAVAVGDFNCNGKPDLALGLPRITYNLAPYFNQTPESGAVKIYYDYASEQDSSQTFPVSSASVSMLSFKDLNQGAHFGASLSAGNLNRDVSRGPGGPPGTEVFFSCDDLIVGAPNDGSGGGAGRAFIFYGQPGGISNSTNQNITDLRSNQPTCNGDFDNSSCTPVVLVPNLTTHFGVDSDYTQSNAARPSLNQSKSFFGFKVSFVGDFTADGYGDVVVTDPNCSWDGPINRSVIDGSSNRMPGVGCGYLFFGGPNGVRNDQFVGTVPDSSASNLPVGIPQDGRLLVPFVKFYPPIPQANMHFGASISSGAEIDGRLPVQIPMPGQGLILASGSDFVVGAPDFDYDAGFSSQGSYPNIPAWNSQFADSVVSQDPVTGANTRKFTPPLNKAWAPSADWRQIPVPSSTALKNSTGIAFAYFGRHSFKNYLLGLDSVDSVRFPSGEVSCTDCASDRMKGMQLTSQLSLNIRDRRNGSLNWSPMAAAAQILSDPLLNPVSNFFNCGSRGATKTPVQRTSSSGYYYEHLSCLAGRNNFSVIFPDLKDNDASISQFGSAVSVAGTKEENAIALFNIAASNPSNLTGDSFKLNDSSNAQGDLSSRIVYNPQNKVHFRIKGSPLWELAVPGFHYTPGPGETFDSVSGPFPIRRAPIFEELTSTVPTGSDLSITPGESMEQNDINRDGYADILISSEPVGSTSSSVGPARIFTYFGNFAGDFSSTVNYSPAESRFHSNASCGVSVDSTNVNAQTVLSTGSISNPSPFSVFDGRSLSEVRDSNPQQTRFFTLNARFPYTRIPGDKEFFATLDGQKGGGSLDLGIVTRSGAVGQSCKPQMITHFYGTASSLSTSDLDRDGMSDLLVGFSSHDNNRGLAKAHLSSVNSASGFAKTGRGIGSGAEFSGDLPFSKMGSAVAAVNWLFRPVISSSSINIYDEIHRRDAWVGASGRDNGAGAVFDFKASGYSQATVSSQPAAGTPLVDSSNTPNNLNAEHSRVIGDVNGDGKEDILTPVLRRDSQGNVFYDAILYFGSALGPITNSYCKQLIGSLSLTSTGGGSALPPSLCLGTPTPPIAYLNGTAVPLPQYLSRPTGVGTSWSIYAFPAGDVNKDGKDDVVAFDSYAAQSKLYLFFGYAGGLDVSIPTKADNSLHAQLVTEQSGLGGSAYDANLTSNASIYPNLPVRHGDFNGDGFEDLAVGNSGSTSSKAKLNQSSDNKGWLCSTGYLDTTQTNEFTKYCTDGDGVPGHGSVTVFYGGPYGFQAPLSGDYGLSQTPRCDHFYETCTEGFSSKVKGVYGSLVLGSNNGYSYDSAAVTCSPGVSGGPANCGESATRILNPLFYNIEDSFLSMQGLRFGDSLTVGDFNADGIDDLAVGMSGYWIPDFHKTAFKNTVDLNMRNFGNLSGQSTIQDTASKGSVFIYYGSPRGVLAPKAREMVADYGLAIDSSKNSLQKPVFAVSPPVWNLADASGNANTAPRLDQHPSAGRRYFASNLASGDFDSIKINGKIASDLAVASGNGQIYIYYGPLCAADNDPTNWYQQTYKYPKIARTSEVALTSGSQSIDLNCTVLNMNTLSASPTDARVSVSKPILPQLIDLSDTITPSHALGTTLLAKMPRDGGNINGDPGLNPGDSWLGTSDLVIGSAILNDPSISMPGSKSTGVGYVLFGHPKSVAGDSFQTTPGLYVGPIDFRATLRADPDTSGANPPGPTIYHYAPMQLRPYDPNFSGSAPIGQFFYSGAWLGDLNGDKSGDLLMSTPDLNRGADSAATPLIWGGGFTLWY